MSKFQKLVDLISPLVINVKVEEIGNYKFCQFTYRNNNFKLQFSNKKIDWLIMSVDDTFEYSVNANWNKDLNYIGVSDNSLIPKGFEIEKVTAMEFITLLT